MATPLHSADPKPESRAPLPGHLMEGGAELHHVLRLSRALQTSLDPTRLIELFSSEMQAVIPHDGLVYHNRALDVSCQLGRMSRHRCTYNLNIGDEPLGEIQFRRRRKFREEEIALLEDLICNLLYPLRNALLYQDALLLSQKDPLFITPVAMGVSMYIMQKMTPTTMDPAQARMMLTMMPIMFTLLFYQFASGLVLYWATSNLFRVGQQFALFAIDGRPSPPSSDGGGGSPKQPDDGDDNGDNGSSAKGSKPHPVSQKKQRRRRR